MMHKDILFIIICFLKNITSAIHLCGNILLLNFLSQLKEEKAMQSTNLQTDITEMIQMYCQVLISHVEVASCCNQSSDGRYTRAIHQDRYLIVKHNVASIHFDTKLQEFSFHGNPENLFTEYEEEGRDVRGKVMGVYGILLFFFIENFYRKFLDYDKDQEKKLLSKSGQKIYILYEEEASVQDETDHREAEKRSRILVVVDGSLHLYLINLRCISLGLREGLKSIIIFEPNLFYLHTNYIFFLKNIIMPRSTGLALWIKLTSIIYFGRIYILRPNFENIFHIKCCI
ncbi:hypothetical protein ACJX0J_028427 [Zea mays]